MVTLFNCFHFSDEWYLIEMAMAIPPKDIQFSKFVVPEDGISERDWQTVLAEQYLNTDGTKRLCDLYDMPDNGESTSRVAFFIYKTGSRALRTPYGQFELSDTEEAPNRLKSIIEIDEDYM